MRFNLSKVKEKLGVNFKDEFLAIIFALLMLWNLLAAILVIYNKHVERKLFAQIQVQGQELEEAKIKHGQLLLEKSSVASLSRIESIAVTKLHLHTPTAKQVMEQVP